MGKSFVYNAGSAEDDKKKDELWFNFGVFIDGTLNNKENTRLRRKYRQEDENSTLTKSKKREDLKREQEDYDTLMKYGLIRIPDDIDPSQFDAEEYKAYLLGIYRNDIDKAGTDNSYSNDDTNVSRMWKCCKKDYRIYVEGMGTADNKYDSQDGFAFGSGHTGIRARVRLACERIAERIKSKKDFDKNKKVTQITLDVFGFSRGAASARNFVHEVNAKKPYKPQEIEIPDGYDFYEVRGESRNTKRPNRKALGDADGMEINPAYLINGKMPRLGHLGYALLEKGIVTPEELEKIQLIIRFVGVYDTVSSYYEMGALGSYDAYGNLKDDEKIKLAVEALSTHFTDDEKELGLQELGDVSRFQKLVHFTAKDEHRRNFALTRINQMPDKAIEKNFPGVHCDIGGAYENEAEECIDEIGTTAADQSFVSIKSYIRKLFDSGTLDALQQKLIEEHWYRKGELKISREDYGYKYIGIEKIKMPSYYKLTGTRKRIKKEYSYIPLHFMEEFCRNTGMVDFFADSTEAKYPITRDPFLEDVKVALHGYVFGDEPEWEFINDSELKSEQEEREAILAEMMRNQREKEEVDFEFPGIVLNDDQEEMVEIELPEIKINSLNRQAALRKLRHEYLHWSSTRDWFGMEPNDDRKRVYYPKE